MAQIQTIPNEVKRENNKSEKAETQKAEARKRVWLTQDQKAELEKLKSFTKEGATFKEMSSFYGDGLLKDYNVYENIPTQKCGILLNESQTGAGEALIKKSDLVSFLQGASIEVLYQAGLDGRKELLTYWQGQSDGLHKLAKQISKL